MALKSKRWVNLDLTPDQRWVGHCLVNSTLEAVAGMLGILQPCSEHGEHWSVTWLSDRISVFLVGNWALGLQTEVKRGEKVQVVRRCGRPTDKKENAVKDKSFCDKLIFVSWLCVVKPCVCLHVCER